MYFVLREYFKLHMSEQDKYPPQQQPLCHGQQISEVSSGVEINIFNQLAHRTSAI